MRCPTLAELPPPPTGMVGWPWTVETPPLPVSRPDGAAWPRVSIVTPSYNQGQFIEETIRSILLQNYPDLEYGIIDGGSTDDSIAIIKKYDRWLAYWVSEEDRGQAHAITKGLARGNGDLFQWINSDDVLMPGAIREIALAFSGHAVGAGVLCGYDPEHSQHGRNADLSIETLLDGRGGFHQQGLWLPRRNIEAIGIDERYDYAFDWDMTIRYLEAFPRVDYIPFCVAFFRFHKDSKTIKDDPHFSRERHAIRARFSRSLRSPIHRSICRTALRRANWQRHLTEWRTRSIDARCPIAMRMIALGFRCPRERINRFWFGALRRTISASRTP